MTTPSAPSPGSPSPSRPQSARPALDPGDVLAGRYRLTRVVSDDDGPALLWQATDEILARPVAVKILPANGRAAPLAPPFLEAAGRASALAHPGLARVYDAAREERPGLRSGRTVDVAYVVSEWVEGRTLAELLAADGPLEPADAIRLVQDATDALTAAHARGIGHGRVHPGNLLVTPAGRLRVTDAAVAAAVHRQAVPSPGPDGSAPADVVRADTRDLGAVLYAMLTARWPSGSTDQPSAGMPDTPRTASGVYSPRQVRAGVPRALDTLVVRTLDPRRQPTMPAIETPEALSRALAEIDVRTPEPVPAAPARRRRPPRWMLRAVPKLLALALIAAVGLVGYRAGKDVGELPKRPGTLDALVAATPSPGAGANAGVRIDLTKAPVAVKDFDPESRDGMEQSDSVPNAFDGDPSTSWSTDGYRTETFGNLKKGVGLLVDLGSPQALKSVQVGMLTGGADIDLRGANAVGESADDFTVVARVRGAKQVATLTPSAPTPSRYWVVWITKLPKADDGRFRAAVAELVFTRVG